MNKYVPDTQALVKFMNGVKVINDKINNIMKKADKGENIIIIPSALFFEIAYLNEKGSIPVTLNDVKSIIENSIIMRKKIY